MVVTQFEHRAADVQLRIADRITSFAGSMNFVYLHVALFAPGMLVFENSPWPTLTLIVSLEAIFLSTFVMIGQNRQAAFQQAKADRDFQDVTTLLRENTDLTRGAMTWPSRSTSSFKAKRPTANLTLPSTRPRPAPRLDPPNYGEPW